MQEINRTHSLADYFESSDRFYYFQVRENAEAAGCNRLFANTFGAVTPGDKLTRIFPEKEKLDRMLRLCWQEGGIHDTELATRNREGSLLMISWEFSSFTGEGSGQVMVQALGIRADTEAETLGKAAGQMAARYETLDQGQEGLWCFESDEPVPLTADPQAIIAYWRDHSRLLYCNDIVARMYGFESGSELVGTPLSQLMDFSSEQRQNDLTRFVQNRFRPTLVETKEFDRYGNVKYFFNSMEGLVENGFVKTVWGTQKEITEQKLAEERLEKSEKFYRSLIAESQDGIVLTDEQGTIHFAAASVKKVLGHEPGDVTGKNIFSFIHPDDYALAKEAFDRELSKTFQASFFHLRLLNHSGGWTWCVVRGRNMISNPGVGRLVIYFYDDTAGRQMMQALRNQAVALSSVFDLIITCNLDYIIESWNKRAEIVVGYTEAEVKGRFLGELVQLDYGDQSAKEVASVLAQNGNWQGEISFVNRRGERRTVLHTASYLLNEAGERVSIIGTGIDITEKKQAEELLKNSELYYRNLFIHSLDAVLITEPDGNIRFASPSVTAVLGYLPGELTGLKTFDFAHPEDRLIAEEAFRREVISQPVHKFISIRILHKNGNWIWCNVRGHNLLSNPHIGGIVVYLFDDSLRKETEQALIESERRFRNQATVLANVTDVIVTIDMERKVTSWNKVSEKLTGITAEEAVGKPYRDVLKTSYAPFTNEQVFAIVQAEGIWKGEISFTGFDGETRYLLHTISLLYDEHKVVTGMLGVGKDITERKGIEARLQQSENFYRSLAAHSLDGIILTDPVGKVNYCGPSVGHISGYAIEQILGKSIFDFVHVDDHAFALEAFQAELRKESVMNYAVIRLRHADRGWVWCTVRGHNLLHDPVLKGVVIYFTDDTKRKLIEDRLRESESRFRNLIHNLKLGVLLQNEKSEMLVCNQAALDLLGLTEEQLLGTTSFDPRWNVIREDGSAFPGEQHPVPEAIRTRRPVRDVVMGVYRPLSHDRVWLLVNAEPVFDEDQHLIHVICSFADITEQRRLSQQLIEQEIQKQKLITQATIDAQEKERQEIGKELHDNINQQLTTTRLYLEVARDKAGDDLRKLIVMAHKNLADIVREIRQMSQSLVPPTLGDIGLVESVQELCDALKRTHSFQVDFHHRHFSEENMPENMKLMIFRIIQEQVNNIIRHAGARQIMIRMQSDAESIVFSIEDDGQGFDPQHNKKGMGLKNMINRASLFNGRVDMYSTPGQGCSVQITIPVPENQLN